MRGLSHSNEPEEAMGVKPSNMDPDEMGS